MSDELKPCPFCGGEAKAFQHGDVGYVVQCRRCGIWNAGYHAALSHITEDEFSGFVDEESAIAAWNARAERTCEVTYKRGAMYDVARYSCCGYEYPESISEVMVAESYCPNCGAKVVVA